MTTHWFSTHFSSLIPPKIEELLINPGTLANIPKLLNFGFEFRELATSIKKVNSAKNLEEIWKKLEEQSDEFLNFCKQNKLKHPFIMDLIDLWDLSTKVVRTSHIFDIIKEKKHFKARVKAFTRFALKASESNVLNYSLGDLIQEMQTSGKDRHNFSVQHWLKPISYGALAKIQTDDQRLTVIHQNLLQAAAYGNLAHLPTKLATAYQIFNEKWNCTAKRHGDNGGTFISIGKDEASIKINIPLNFHSSIITLSQKKKEKTR